MARVFGNGVVPQISVVYSKPEPACGILDLLTRQLIGAGGDAVIVSVPGLHGVGIDHLRAIVALVVGGPGSASHVELKLGFAMNHLGTTTKPESTEGHRWTA